MDIILYLLQFIQYQHKQICWLINFICRYILLKQWAFDDSHSPKYQKFKIDELPKVISFQQDWNWKDLISYYQRRYGKTIKPVFRRVECDIPKRCTCPACNAPVDYLMWNDGKKKSQVLCKVCQTHFSPTKDNRFSKATIVGGRNPQVQAAGIVVIRGGKIYSINNASGHFKPGNECLEIVEDAFSGLPQNIFSKKGFQGYLPYKGE